MRWLASGAEAATEAASVARAGRGVAEGRRGGTEGSQSYLLARNYAFPQERARAEG